MRFFLVIVYLEAHAMICGAVFLKILDHQANVSGNKYNEDNNNDLFHRKNSFRLSIDKYYDCTISA